ncbi:MAG: hypothetical protein ACO1NU_04045 [Arcticibacter sp.]
MIKLPDYTVHFEEIKAMFGQQPQSFNQEVQTELIDNLVSRLAHKLPERTKTVTRHHFDSSKIPFYRGYYSDPYYRCCCWNCFYFLIKIAFCLQSLIYSKAFCILASGLVY